MALRHEASIHVCPLRLVTETIERTGAGYLVSAIDAPLQPSTPEQIASHRHLTLDMHDICEELPDHIAPARHHVIQLLDFVHGWDRREPMVIHCFAGISRSTAAAFITLCALNPRVSEEAIASRLRHASVTASPNRRFVALADEALGRDGRMMAALERMGQSQPALECVPFGLPIALEAGSRRRARTSHAA